MQGWISLHRKFLSWEWYKNVNTKALFIHLLLMANHEDGEWKGIKVKKGQLITGRKSLSKETGLSEQEIRTALDHLKSTKEITTLSTTPQSGSYSIITINKYNDYQKATKEATKVSTTNNKDNKSNKEQKNNKYIYGEFQNVFLTDEHIKKLQEIYKDKFDEAIGILSSYIENSKTGKGYTNHYAVLSKHNWIYKKIFPNGNQEKIYAELEV